MPASGHEWLGLGADCMPQPSLFSNPASAADPVEPVQRLGWSCAPPVAVNFCYYEPDKFRELLRFTPS